jgi:hypothetical protein
VSTGEDGLTGRYTVVDVLPPLLDLDPRLLNHRRICLTTPHIDVLSS